MGKKGENVKNYRETEVCPLYSVFHVWKKTLKNLAQ
jgi:hypothetical protein